MADSLRTPAALMRDSVLRSSFLSFSPYYYLLSKKNVWIYYRFGSEIHVAYSHDIRNDSKWFEFHLKYIKQNELTWRKMNVLKYVDVVHKSPFDKWFWSASTVRSSIFDSRMLSDCWIYFYVMKSTIHYTNA